MNQQPTTTNGEHNDENPGADRGATVGTAHGRWSRLRDAREPSSVRHDVARHASYCKVVEQLVEQLAVDLARERAVAVNEAANATHAARAAGMQPSALFDARVQWITDHHVIVEQLAAEVRNDIARVVTAHNAAVAAVRTAHRAAIENTADMQADAIRHLDECTAYKSGAGTAERPESDRVRSTIFDGGDDTAVDDTAVEDDGSRPGALGGFWDWLLSSVSPKGTTGDGERTRTARTRRGHPRADRRRSALDRVERAQTLTVLTESIRALIVDTPEDELMRALLRYRDRVTRES